MKLSEIKNRIKNSVLFYEEDFCHIRNQKLESALKNAIWSSYRNEKRKKDYIDRDIVEKIEMEYRR